METIVHDKPKRRLKFTEHCNKGSALGTVFEHWRSWFMSMKDTKFIRISTTVFHKHKCITNPDVTPKYYVIAEAGKFAYDVKGFMPPHLRESTLNQLKHILTILKKVWK